MAENSDRIPETAVAREPGRSDVTGGRLVRNTLINGSASIASALVTVALTPFLLQHLGPEQFGVWLIALSLTFSSGYLALADLGLADAAAKFIAEARATGSTAAISEIASTTVALLLAVGAVVGTAIALLASAIVRVFGISPQLQGPARLVFALMALGVIVELPAAGLLAVVQGAQRYSWLKAIDVIGRLSWGAVVVVAVSAGHGVVVLAAASVAVAALEMVAAYVIAHRVQPGLRLRPGLVRRDTLRKILPFGSGIAGLRVLSVIYAQMDRAIIGIVLALAAVASYEIAFRISSVSTLVLVMASSAILPATAYNAARGDRDKQRQIFLRGTKYALALVVAASLAAIIYADQLISTWVGDRYLTMAFATRLFLLFPLIAGLQQVGVAMLLGLGMVRRVVLLQVIAVGINLVVSVALVRPLGVAGVILGSLVGGAAVAIPYTRLFLSTFDVRVATWFRRIVLPNLPGGLVQLGVGLITLPWVVGLHQFWQVGAVCAASVGLSLLVFAIVGLGGDERRGLLTQARSG